MNKNITTRIISVIAVAALGLSQLQAESYDFKDPKGINNVAFSLDAPLEYISGTGNGISGSVDFDPADPGKTTGTIILETKTLMVPNAMMLGHIVGKDWMHVEAFPTITFEAAHLKDLSEEGGKVSATAVGSITIKGITREIEVPVSLTYLPGKLKARNRGEDGDILVIRSEFTILRSDFDINAGKVEDKVSDKVELKLSIAGFHVK